MQHRTLHFIANYWMKIFRNLGVKINQLSSNSKIPKFFGPFCLTPLLPVYEYIVLWNPALSCYCCAILQLYNLPIHCARELFKLSSNSANILVCNEKIFLWQLHQLSKRWQIFNMFYVFTAIRAWLKFVQLIEGLHQVENFWSEITCAKLFVDFVESCKILATN